MTTNLDKWFYINDGLSTPNNMIQWSWFFTVSAALQRRVWIGQYDNIPLFPAMYIVLTSQPGVGKSLIIGKVTNLIKHWKVGDNQALLAERFKSVEHKQTVETMQQVDVDIAEKNAFKPKDKEAEIVKPYLFPVAADATTYEALILAFGKCYRRINHVHYSEKAQKDIIGVYGHSSLCFILPELTSLIRKRTHDTVTFLLGLYDCPLDYEYDTITREKDRIRRGCLNILAATNPDRLKEAMNDKLIDGAFNSRIFYIFAHKNRKNVMFIPDLTEDQLKVREDLRKHILKLSVLYGEVKVPDKAKSWLAEWWNKHEESKEKINPRLLDYKTRENIHLLKVAMALHFSESTEMEIPFEVFPRAADILAKEKKTMHLALSIEAKDDVSRMINKTRELLANTAEMKFIDLYAAIHETLGLTDKDALKSAIDFLVETETISKTSRSDEQTEKTVVYYKLL